MFINNARMILIVMLALMPLKFALADLPWQFADNTRYMAIGDSLTAGYGAFPGTQGFAYILYENGVFDVVQNTLFANTGVPGATSEDILLHQVPQMKRFYPHVVTLTVGGNDLLKIMAGADPVTVLTEFQMNLIAILASIRAEMPTADIIVGNLYSVSEIPGADQVVFAFNQIVTGVAASVGGVKVADVHGAFADGNGLLLIERNGVEQFQVHPTNAGYRVMADAFAEAYFAE